MNSNIYIHSCPDLIRYCGGDWAIQVYQRKYPLYYYSANYSYIGETVSLIAALCICPLRMCLPFVRCACVCHLCFYTAMITCRLLQ